MLNSLIIFVEAAALAGAQVPVAAVPTPVVPARGLRDLPNTTIEYYDVSGTDPKSIRESMAAARAGTAEVAAGTPPTVNWTPTTATWTLGANISRRTVDGKCSIAAANLKFGGKVVLPRLVGEDQVAAPMQTAWRTYLTGLETGAASTLWFVHDRVGTIQKAILASSCEGANTAATAAIEQLRTEEAEFRRQAAVAAAAAAAAQAAATAAKPEPAKKSDRK